MKQGWTYKKFKDICISISDGDWIEKKDQSLSGIRLIQTGNIGVGKFLPKKDSKRFISEETFKRLRCSEIFEGDVLISRLPNPLGRSCCLPKLSTKCITAVDCSILKLNKGLVIPQYFIYYTQSDSYFSEINSQSSGTTRARITRKKLEETQIPLAPLSEQQRIVKRLDSAFAHIDELKANAEKQVNEARALFQKALSKAMEPKEGWVEKSLGDLAIDMYRGSGIKRDQVTKEGTPCVRYGEIYTTYNVAFEECVSHTKEEYVSSPKYFEHGDLLFAITGESVEDIGKTIAYLGHEKCLCGGDIICMKHKQNPKFLAYALSTPNAIRQKGIGKTKLKVVHTNAPALKAIKIPVPSLSEQQRIVERLDSLSANVKALEENQRKVMAECDALKQALLRKVFE